MSQIDGETLILPPVLVNGAHSPATAATVKAVSPASSVYTFTAKFAFVWRGVHLTFRAGHSVSLPTDLRAALIAASAPMVAA